MSDEEETRAAEEALDALERGEAKVKSVSDLKPITSFDLPSTAFPFKIIFIDKDTKETWHEIEVKGPGVVDIPAAKQHGINESLVRIEYPDGTVITP